MLRESRPILTAVLVSIAFISAADAQTIWHVDVANCPGPGDGSPGNPFCTIQNAINATAAHATPPDEIIVADGVYTGTGNRDLDFGGKLITLRSQNGPDRCTIDCQSSGRGFYFHSGETAASVVDGFTIQNGSASSSSPGSYYGGGVFCSGASPTLTNCVISGNTAAGTSSRGGGVYCCNSSSPTLTDCLIRGNTAAAGGGINCYTSCSPTLTNCMIGGNTAGSGGGGGVYCYSNSNMRLVNCVINVNRANGTGHGYGGGMYCDYSSPILTNCTFSGNYAATVYGGGVFCYSSTSLPKFTNCILWGDTPPEFYVSSGTPVVTYCDVQGGYTGVGNIDVDPAFACSADYHLRPSSPCIDEGTNTPTGGLPSHDADGRTRPMDGNGDGLAAADMGAYEFDPTLPVMSVEPTQIAFTVSEGQTGSEETTLWIQNVGHGLLQWTLAWDAPYLQADPLQGESTGEFDTVTLTISSLGLSRGAYSTTLQVIDPVASKIPVAVEVRLYVTGSVYVPSEFATIQAAIDAALPFGEQVVVADGVYTGTGNKDLDFHGKAITVRSESGNAAACIIDCQGSGRGFYFHSGEKPASVVDGFTIRNGNVTSGSPGSGYGGGVYCSGSSPTLTNCTITENTASSYGGGLCCSSSSPTLSNCTINWNRSSSGGGVYCSYSNPSLTGCCVSNNADGGLSCFSSSPTVTSCMISNNCGGLGCWSSSSPTITDCIISNNSGGGVFCSSYSNPTLAGCTISGNRAYSGAGLGCTSSSPRLTNCIILRNRAAWAGGGVYCSSSSAPILTNCTIYGNTSGNFAGGVFCSSSNPSLVNCVLWGDSPQEIFGDLSNLVVAYCDVQGGYTGAGNIDADPGFAFGDNFHLMPGSPCIDAGTNSPSGGLPAWDAEGNIRPLDGNGDGQAVADIGAYEFNPASPAIAISPARIEFFIPEGSAATESKILSIRNTGGSVLHWTLDWDGSWLQADPVQGQSTGEVNTITLTAGPSALSHGSYSAILAVTDLQACNNPRIIEVRLCITRTSLVPGDFATIQAALDAAMPGDTILVADGTYTGVGNKDLDFHGKDVTLRSESREPTACIIDCQGSGRGFYFHSGESGKAVMEGFTIRNGNGITPGTSLRSGGGVYCKYSDPTIVHCIVSNNVAGGSYATGGGMYFSESSPRLSDCTIIANAATASTGGGQGGGIYFIAGSPVMTACTVTGNTATGTVGNGGGLCWYWSNPLLANCTITGNAAHGNPGTGGGIYSNSYTPTLTNCTISGNTADGLGGGVYHFSYGSFLFRLNLTNCILWGDSPQEIYQDGLSSDPTVAYSDIQGGYAGVGNLNAEPRFIDAVNGNLHLAANSPCIDVGSNTAVPAGITTDLNGNPRILRGKPLHTVLPRPGQPVPPPPPMIVDMGAYEFKLAPLPEPDEVPIAPPIASPSMKPGKRGR